MGVAEILASMKNELRGTVKFIFSRQKKVPQLERKAVPSS
jgi:hypothetical protein